MSPPLAIRKLRALDLFCGAGGATKGLQRAGFHVTGVDIKPQPRYCGDEFIQGDAVEFCDEHGHEFDFIWASPLCQRYSSLAALHPSVEYACFISSIFRIHRQAISESNRITQMKRNPKLNPIVGDVFDHNWYGSVVQYQVRQVSGKARKVHGPGYMWRSVIRWMKTKIESACADRRFSDGRGKRRLLCGGRRNR